MDLTEKYEGETYDKDWHERAACAAVYADDMYPSSVRDQRRTILAVCEGLGCAVKLSCLVDAVENGDSNGVWGGLTEGERKSSAAKQIVAMVRNTIEDEEARRIALNTNPIVEMGMPRAISFDRIIGRPAQA